MHLIHVVAADVREHVGVLARAPVHEVAVAVVPRLDHRRLSQAELAEPALAVKLAGQERAIVEALVVFDADEKALVAGRAFDPGGLGVGEHERLDREHVLVGLKARHDDREVQLIRERHERDLARRHLGEHVFIQRWESRLRIDLGEVGVRRERLTREGLEQRGIVGQRFERDPAPPADVDFADRAFPLQLVKRRQNLDLRDHTAADQEDARLCFVGHMHLLGRHLRAPL